MQKWWWFKIVGVVLQQSIKPLMLGNFSKPVFVCNKQNFSKMAKLSLNNLVIKGHLKYHSHFV